MTTPDATDPVRAIKRLLPVYDAFDFDALPAGARQGYEEVLGEMWGWSGRVGRRTRVLDLNLGAGNAVGHYVVHGCEVHAVGTSEAHTQVALRRWPELGEGDVVDMRAVPGDESGVIAWLRDLRGVLFEQGCSPYHVVTSQYQFDALSNQAFARVLGEIAGCFLGSHHKMKVLVGVSGFEDARHKDAAAGREGIDRVASEVLRCFRELDTSHIIEYRQVGECAGVYCVRPRKSATKRAMTSGDNSV